MSRDTAAVRDALLAAPWRPDGWSIALRALSEHLSHPVAQLLGGTYDREVVFEAHFGVPKGAHEAWVAGGGLEAARNPRSAAAFVTPAFAVTTDDDYISAEQRDRHPLYRTVYRPLGLDQSLMCRFPIDAGSTAVLSLMRPGAGPAGSAGKRALTRLVPALGGAVTLQAKLERHAAELAGSVWDSAAHGVILLNEWLRITHATRSGLRYLNESHRLSAKNGQLSAVDGASDRRLQGSLRAILREGAAQAHIWLAGPGFGQAITAVRTPPQAFGFAAIAVLLPDESPSRELLIAASLTPAEAEIASALVQGERPAVIAERRGVSITTVRAQVRQVYEKLEVSGVAQLGARLRQLGRDPTPGASALGS